jgi:hypothetical protein
MMNRTIVAAIVALMAGIASAHGHARLDHAVPSPGSRVSARPSSLYLCFTEGVLPHFSGVEVLGPSGQPVRIGTLQSADGGRGLIVPIPPLAPGEYTVVWHITSEDTHKTEGRFNFTLSP